MKLTWNQRRALERMAARGDDPYGLTTAQMAELPDVRPYLCGASARTAAMALVRKGLAECIPVSPLHYRITEAGRQALKGCK